jgi:hypothetical protein
VTFSVYGNNRVDGRYLTPVANTDLASCHAAPVTSLHNAANRSSIGSVLSRDCTQGITARTLGSHHTLAAVIFFNSAFLSHDAANSFSLAG